MEQPEVTRQDAIQIALLNNRHLQMSLDQLGVAESDFVQAGLFTNPSFAAVLGFGLLWLMWSFIGPVVGEVLREVRTASRATLRLSRDYFHRHVIEQTQLWG